jgi:hypothetical protein
VWCDRPYICEERLAILRIEGVRIENETVDRSGRHPCLGPVEVGLQPELDGPLLPEFFETGIDPVGGIDE